MSNPNARTQNTAQRTTAQHSLPQHTWSNTNTQIIDNDHKKVRHDIPFAIVIDASGGRTTIMACGLFSGVSPNHQHILFLFSFILLFLLVNCQSFGSVPLP